MAGFLEGPNLCLEEGTTRKPGFLTIKIFRRKEPSWIPGLATVGILSRRERAAEQILGLFLNSARLASSWHHFPSIDTIVSHNGFFAPHLEAFSILFSFQHSNFRKITWLGHAPFDSRFLFYFVEWEQVRCIVRHLSEISTSSLMVTFDFYF